MDQIHLRRIVHLLNRAGFGPSPQDFDALSQRTVTEAVEYLFAASEKYENLEVVNPENVPYDLNLKKLAFKQRRAMKRRLKIGKQKLNFQWLLHMAFSPAQLREKMAFFWHDHFACNVGHSLKIQKQINTIRSHALEYFGDMVVALSKDPAMIEYLNSKQNVKKHPNENFGRELLELFTIGIGHYSEADIQQAARAFTGWRFDHNGEFYIDKKTHDDGMKTFMGRHGKFTGDDIIDIILENPQTGEHIASKIYQFLCGREIDPVYLDNINREFYQSGYHIGTLVRRILTDEVFYAEDIVGQRIKSPIELIVGLLRITQARPSKGSFTQLAQKRFQQKLLSPPDVSGWKSGRQWIDVSTLAERLNLASVLLQHQVNLSQRAAPLTDEGDDERLSKRDKVVRIKSNLKPLKALAEIQGQGQTIDYLTNLLFTTNTEHLKELFEELNTRYESGDLNFRQTVIRLLSLPEYQMN